MEAAKQQPTDELRPSVCSLKSLDYFVDDGEESLVPATMQDIVS